MRTTSTLTIAAAALALGVFPSAAVAGDKASDAKKDPARQICKTVVPTGSRMGTRVCRSASDWNSSSRRTQEDLLRGQLENSVPYDQGVRDGQI